MFVVFLVFKFIIRDFAAMDALLFRGDGVKKS